MEEDDENIVDEALIADSFNMMSSMDDIIEAVLNKLSMKNLHCCARVCKKWSRIVHNIKKRCHLPNWLLLEDDFEESIINKLEILACEPKIALIFSSTELYEDHNFSITSNNHKSRRTNHRPARRRRVEIHEYLSSVLPPGCQLTGVASSGVVGTNSACTSSDEHESGFALSALFLPSLPGLDIYTFNVKNDIKNFNFDELSTDDSRKDKLRSVTNIPRDKCPKLVVLFFVEQINNGDSDICAALVKQYKSVVVAGGFVDHLLVSDRDHADDETKSGEIIMQGLAFCGENVKVASVLLPYEVKDLEGALLKIAELKSAKIPEKNSVGFMFACIGRGEYHYNSETKSLEAKAFHKLFPHTPLMGFFGNGELGYEYLPNYSTGECYPSVVKTRVNEEGETVHDIPTLHHSYTTVFVLLSLGS